MVRDPTNDSDALGPVARRLAATQRVVLVEDEPDIATFLRAYFRASGFDSVHLDPDSVEDAMARLHEHAPDVVLLDLRLRGFSGREIYRQMRSDERWAFTPVVMVSADGDPELRRTTGLDAFVPKPFNTNTLADVVRDRLQVAATLADEERSRDLPLLSQRYLEARLDDEIAMAGPRGHFSFALVRVLDSSGLVASVGHDGRDHVVAQLAGRLREALPGDVVVGLSDAGELAVVLPSCDVTITEATLEPVLQAANGVVDFAGGARVAVAVAAGIAGYPYHASTPNELFMAADAALADATDAGDLLGRAL